MKKIKHGETVTDRHKELMGNYKLGDIPVQWDGTGSISTTNDQIKITIS